MKAEADKHVSLSTFSLYVCRVSPESAKIVAQQSMPNVLRLAASPLLQGYALRYVLCFTAPKSSLGHNDQPANLPHYAFVIILQVFVSIIG